MKALLIYAHPNPDSYTAAVKAATLEELVQARADVRVIDLYAAGFDPTLSAEALASYADKDVNRQGVEAHCADVAWCDTLIFVYPTWWYGQPAILKGWLDRVLLPGVAFELPQVEGGDIQPGLRHITRLAVLTTCGASWWLTRWIGAPGRRTLLRGIRLLCARRCRTCFAALYSMDTKTAAHRRAHLEQVRARLRRFLGR